MGRIEDCSLQCERLLQSAIDNNMPQEEIARWQQLLFMEQISMSLAGISETLSETKLEIYRVRKQLERLNKRHE